MKISEVLAFIEDFAPLSYQEAYDNAGLIVGNKDLDLTGVLLCLDSIEAVVDEAIDKKCNLIVAHHPIVFSGLKKITGRNYIERVVIKAIKHDICIYAAHTNLDNVRKGVNQRIAEQLNLQETEILQPKSKILQKLYTYVPQDHSEKLLDALFKAGAGQIGNYSECSFASQGTGSFKGNEESDPYVGQKGERHFEKEVKIEVILPNHLKSGILKALHENHPYEAVAHEIVALENEHIDVGSGLIGELVDPIPEALFLSSLKEIMKTSCVRHTRLLGRNVKKVALCGGSGSFLLETAIRAKADVFITGDFKYHQFFDADNQIVIADIGHYESEQFTINLFYDLLREKFGNFAVYLTKIDTNPINYL